MAVIFLTGFEIQSGALDGLTLQGTSAYSTTQHRTGSTALRCNPASSASGFASYTGTTGWEHFGLYIATMPTVARLLMGQPSADGLRLNTDGTLSMLNNAGSSLGTSTMALATGQWYWIGVNWHSTGSSAVILQINGTDQVTATQNTGSSGRIGCPGTEASTIDVYFDDFIIDDTGFLPPSNVGLLIPTSDNAKGTGWTNDAAGTTNLFDAVNNTPPVGIADTTGGSGLHQLRNATSNANTAYDANMTTYASLGVNVGDIVLAVVASCATAAPVATQAKVGTFSGVSNPAITPPVNFNGAVSGDFWSGTAAGTYATGWTATRSPVQASPSITVGTAPVMRVSQTTANTRIAMVCFMGIYVAWTPITVPYYRPYTQLLAQ